MSSFSAPPEPALQGAARLLAEGRPAAAAERLAGIVAETPTYAAAHVLRATALEAAGFIDEALVAWGRAAALVPRSPLVHRERARLLAAQVADVPGALPPPIPDPSAAPRPAPEPDDDDGADGPLLNFGMPKATASGTPPTADPFAAAMPPAAEARPPTSPLPPVPPDWGALEDADAPVLPPVADEPSGTSPTWPPAPEGADVPESEPEFAPPTDDLSERPPDLGWEILGETEAAPFAPGATVEPDVVAPEGTPPIAPEAPDDPVHEVEAVDEASPQDRSVVDELDDLISQLEHAPRIKPDPAFDGPEVSLDYGDVDDMASETLAKIYAAQHQYVEAALVYEKLAARQPADAERLLGRAAELREKAG